MGAKRSVAHEWRELGKSGFPDRAFETAWDVYQHAAQLIIDRTFRVAVTVAPSRPGGINSSDVADMLGDADAGAVAAAKCHMIPHNITKRSFKRYLVQAELSRETRFHDLRHTAATLLLASGVNVKVVSEMLGHSNVAITLRIYAHVLPHMQQSAVQAMDQLLEADPKHRHDELAWLFG
jgi:hypothetical protein